MVDETGAVVREGVVDSDPEAIAVYVRSKAPDAERIGLETGPTSTWLWTELKQLGLPVICIDARHAKAVLKMQINKSDRNDAIGIARIMQTGWFKEVHVKDIRQCSCSHDVWQRGREASFSRTRRRPLLRKCAESWMAYTLGCSSCKMVVMKRLISEVRSNLDAATHPGTVAYGNTLSDRTTAARRRR